MDVNVECLDEVASSQSPVVIFIIKQETKHKSENNRDCYQKKDVEMTRHREK